MRFYLFDRVTAFESGVRAVGVKNISFQESFLDGHYARLPVMPEPLIIEALAQLGGWTVTTSSEYRYLALMVMVKKIAVPGDAGPGDQLRLEVALEQLNEFGAMISARALVDERPVLSVGSITYALYEIPAAERAQTRDQYCTLAGQLQH